MLRFDGDTGCEHPLVHHHDRLRRALLHSRWHCFGRRQDLQLRIRHHHVTHDRCWYSSNHGVWSGVASNLERRTM